MSQAWPFPVATTKTRAVPPVRRPDYELLKDAYAIFGGIPDTAFHLDRIVRKHGSSKGCGTIACGIGWLAMHPAFNEKGLTLRHGDELCYQYSSGRSTNSFALAAADIFGITESEGSRLFKGVFDDDHRYIHKNILLNRIMRLLDDHRQVRNPVYLKERSRG